MKPYIAQIRSSLRLMYRDRSVLFLSMIFPLVFFFIFAQVFHAGSSSGAMSRVLAMVLVIGVLGSGFFGAGIRTVLDRETNILRRFKVAPINAGPIIVASMVSGWFAYIPTVFLFLAIGKLYYHAALPPQMFSFLFFLTIGLLTFRAMGMIIAAVVNSQQEASIVIQLLYLPMLFLSGSTFPTEIMPDWLRVIANFLPATYLYAGMNSIALGESAFSKSNLISALCLVTAMAVALFIGIKLFRWEKEEKISGRAKAWILVVLAPFIISGVYQAKSKESDMRAKQMDRKASRMRSFLLNNVNIFVGNGETIQGGAVLVRDGKIAQVFRNPPQETKALNADVVELAGTTLMPGLIDMHVHIGAPGGVYADQQKYAQPNLEARRLAAYLYSGITTVRSTGDLVDGALALRKVVSDSGQYEGAQFLTCGPLFTTDGGHPEELVEQFPPFMREMARAQFLRKPRTADEARAQVDDLKKSGIDCIKAVLESGSPAWGKFNHLDPQIYRAVIAEAIKQGIPTATHTGNAADVRLAIEAGSNTIEHGSVVDLIPEESFAAMKAHNIAYDPTLSIFEALGDLASGRTQLLNRPLLKKVGPDDLLRDTQTVFNKPSKPGDSPNVSPLETAKQNLQHAYHSGVTLITGTDAGNMMVIHGPTVQHELKLWVDSNIPTTVALQAATYNSAKALHLENHIGIIREGMDATFIILDGDPVQDITATELINAVYLRGEHIDRDSLLRNQFKP